MARDFNSDMFSAILKANENSMALLEKQLEDSQKQAKRKDIVFCIILLTLCALLGGMITVYYFNKPTMNVDYDQALDKAELINSNVDYNNKITE